MYIVPTCSPCPSIFFHGFFIPKIYTKYSLPAEHNFMMALVEYSESDSSDTELHSKSHAPLGENAKLHKAAFQKVVDRSNPHRILVNLSEQSKPNDLIAEEAAEPLPKKQKCGSNSFSGFNSILPAPKKSLAAGRADGGTDRFKTGLKIGVNLKTGATPGFHRGAPVAEQKDEFAETKKEEASHPELIVSSSVNPPLMSSAESIDHVKPESHLKGNPMMFKPLSVARKTKKKPSLTQNEEFLVVTGQTPESTRKSEFESKISLFSAATIEPPSVLNLPFNGQYQPLVYASTSSSTTTSPVFSEGKAIPDATIEDIGYLEQEYRSSNNSPQSLNTIAEDLNLSTSAKRQLLGRHRSHPLEVNLVNFNTDREYAANEILRQAGEQVQHNPVRAIAPGKHSLKQLVNAVSSQKEALEEHFATGKRNKKEAGSKYGW